MRFSDISIIEFRSSSLGECGGGFFVSSATVLLHAIVFSGCTCSTGFGGAVGINSANAIIVGCTFRGNSVPTQPGYKGGAIAASNSNVQLTDCMFDLNEASSGGAISVYLSDLRLSG